MTAQVRSQVSPGRWTVWAKSLRYKLQHELRRRTRRQVTVVSENNSPAIPLGKKLLSLIVREG